LSCTLNIRAGAAAGLMLWLASGCAATTGHLAFASTRAVGPDALDMHSRPARHVIGRSCVPIIVFFPARIPNFGDALDEALRQGKGEVLSDVVIGYEVQDIPFVCGRACYVVEGNVR